jgi:alpha-tubulin suppressor-like RCC1 family protein
MAITDKKTGVWGLDQTFNKINQGSIWTYSGVASLFVWGANNNGSLGVNNTTEYSSPVQIPGSTWQYLSHGSGSTNDTDHAFATKTDGTLWGWGNGNNGGLGLNNETKYSSPIQIGSDTNWSSQIEVTGQSSFAIKTDGTLWAWGKNDSGYGRLGLNNKTNYSSPVQIPGSTWDKINTYNFCTLATKTDGTLWAWGHGDTGRLGLNSNTSYSSPKQVPGSTWGTAISGGGTFAGAIKTDGTLWMFGFNNSGQLGQNNTTTYSSPKQVPGTTWSKMSSLSGGVLAIKTDGTLWGWGSNASGRLGLNQSSNTKYSSPVQVPGTTWSKVLCHNQSVIAVKTDNTMWTWGKNDSDWEGMLGHNDAVNRSSPTQLAGTWDQGDSQIGSTDFGFMAFKDL